MIFPYSSVFLQEPLSGDLLLLRRPEIPVVIRGSRASMALIGLVDTGSDYSIFPVSLAEYLGIELHPLEGPSAEVFGGQTVNLLASEAELILQSEHEQIAWGSTVHFADFQSIAQEPVLLGHAGFLDYFTATFDGLDCTLSLEPNSALPASDP